MKKTLAILIATTGLTAILALPSWSAVQAEVGVPSMQDTSVAEQNASPLTQVSDNDDGEDDDNEGGEHRGSKHDDDDDGEDDDCDDDNSGCARGKNPDRAGSVAPPDNGLFGDGDAPKVNVN